MHGYKFNYTHSHFQIHKQHFFECVIKYYIFIIVEGINIITHRDLPERIRTIFNVLYQVTMSMKLYNQSVTIILIVQTVIQIIVKLAFQIHHHHNGVHRQDVIEAHL